MVTIAMYNSKFTRYTKTFLNPYTWQFLKIYSICNYHQNHTEEFCQPHYFEKNQLYHTLPFSDLIFVFFMKLYFLCDIYLAFLRCYIKSLTQYNKLGNCGGNCRAFSLIDSPLLDINLRKQ